VDFGMAEGQRARGMRRIELRDCCGDGAVTHSTCARGTCTCQVGAFFVRLRVGDSGWTARIAQYTSRHQSVWYMLLLSAAAWNVNFRGNA
jgi:hypothetical protein